MDAITTFVTVLALALAAIALVYAVRSNRINAWDHRRIQQDITSMKSDIATAKDEVAVVHRVIGDLDDPPYLGS